MNNAQCLVRSGDVLVHPQCLGPAAMDPAILLHKEGRLLDLQTDRWIDTERLKDRKTDCNRTHNTSPKIDRQSYLVFTNRNSTSNTTP